MLNGCSTEVATVRKNHDTNSSGSRCRWLPRLFRRTLSLCQSPFYEQLLGLQRRMASRSPVGAPAAPPTPLRAEPANICPGRGRSPGQEARPLSHARCARHPDVCFRHGLRASELCGLTWAAVDFTTARLTGRRCKARSPRRSRSLATNFASSASCIAAKRPAAGSCSSARGPVVGSECGLPLVHPRMLRHACGFALADKRATCARSRTISAMPVKNTVVYTNLAPSRFDSIWD
jgi:type 1 fimbriae regulatory protein FimB